MASIRKRGSTFQITVSNGYNSSGKRVIETKTFVPDPTWSEKRALSEAQKFAVRFEDKIKAGGTTSGEKTTFEKFSVKFLKDMEEGNFLAATSLNYYRQCLNNRIIPKIGQLKLTQVTNHTVNEFLKEIRQDGTRLDERSGKLSEETLAKYRATISSVLSYAVEEGYLPLNPLIYSGKQRARARTKREYKTKQLSIEQARSFLWLLDHPVQIRRKEHTVKRNGRNVLIKEYSQQWSLDLKWRLFFYIALFTGARRGEIISLLWEDIDFSKRIIRFSKSTSCVKGEVIHKETKTHATRQCVVPDAVIKLALEILEEQKKYAFKLGNSWMGFKEKDFLKNYIFIQEDGSQMDISSPRTEFKRLIRIYNTNVAGEESEMLPQDITLHDLRHTAASILINSKMDPRSVSGVLGHSNTSTTLNIYAYFFHQAYEEAAQIMESVLLL